MLSSTEKNKLTDKVNTAFAAIGKNNGTKMPPSANNADSYAFDLWVAHQLVSLANKRKEMAEKVCIREGLMIDKETDPRLSGTKEVLFNGENVAISLAVSNAADRLDPKRFATELELAGVDPRVIEDARRKATSKSRPAHVFSTYLLTND